MKKMVNSNGTSCLPKGAHPQKVDIWLIFEAPETKKKHVFEKLKQKHDLLRNVLAP